MEKEKNKEIFLFTGEEAFLVNEQIRNWKKLAEEKYGEFNILFTEINVPDKEAEEYVNRRSKEIAAELITPPFFGGKRVIFLDNFPISESSNKSQKDFEKYSLRIIRSLENIAENNVVILSSINPDKRTRIWKLINEIANVKVFNKLNEIELTEWIQKRVSNLGGKILPAAAPFLAKYSGNDLWKIDREISKLVNFCPDKPIAESDIEKICIPSIEIISFGLSNALQEGNIKKVIEIFHNEIDSGTAPQTILMRDLAPLMRQILNVSWALENKKTAESVGIQSWIFNKWRNTVKNIPFDEAKKAYEALMLIDEGMKIGKIEVKSDDTKMFALVIEAFFLEFFSSGQLDIKNPLLKKE